LRTERPVFLNFARIQFPVGAVASIGHRLSGVLLVLALPLAVLALQRSLAGEVAFFALAGWARVPAALLAWACAHHLFAGIRHLLMDVGIGASLSAARRSAYAALITATAIGVMTLLA
jgi:succinate dehydrogenase / fumarate reductase, cytochrome b subunit